MTEKVKDPIQAEFEALPLDKKIANLMKMEAVTISETFTYVVNSAMKTFEGLGDSIEQFGSKVEREAHKAAEATKAKTMTPAAKPKSRPAKKGPTPPRNA